MLHNLGEKLFVFYEVLLLLKLCLCLSSFTMEESVDVKGSTG